MELSIERSIHKHEQEALNKIDFLLKKQQDSNQLALFPCCDLMDYSNKSFNEADVVLLSRSFLAVIELKHWAGTIEIDDYYWRRNGGIIDNPHKLNNYKCKLLKSTILKDFPSIKKQIPFSTSILTLTYADAEIYNSDNPKTTKERTITFSSIHDLCKFIGKKIGDNSQHGKNILSDVNFNQIKKKLKLKFKPRSFSNQIPGFKILETIQNKNLFTSFIAEPNSLTDNKRKRLRLFGTPQNDQTIFEKQKRCLDTLAEMAPHPNILRVWNHANEDNLIIEVSNWDNCKTLREILKNSQKLQIDKIINISKGILNGLAHIHNNDILHRDLCPENISIYGDTAQIMNFDLAFTPESDVTVMSETIRKEVTPYTPKEISERKESYASDVYSFGVVLFEMLTKKVPLKSWDELIETDGYLADCKFPTTRDPLQELCLDVIKKSITLEADVRPSITQLIQIFNTDETISDDGTTTKNEIIPNDYVSKHWQIIKLIGKGTSSQVYKARNADSDFALKIFNIEIPPERCQKELNCIRSLLSPSIIECEKTISDWEDNRSFLQLQFVPGKTIKQLVEEKRYGNLTAFFSVSIQLLTALEEMHQEIPGSKEALIHNDLNPSNIILNEIIQNEVEPKIIDFGESGKIGIGPLCGTLKYVSQALIVGSELNYCYQGDLYSVALTLIEWLTGICPTNENSGTPDIDEIEKILKLWVDKQEISNSDNKVEFCANLNAWFNKMLEQDEVKWFESSSKAKQKLEYLLKDLNDFNPKKETPELFDNDEPGENKIKETLLKDEDNQTSKFVSYINTIHNASPANENALAESQAVNQYFGQIQVKHEITNLILNKISESSDISIVVLTGHAGDGKTTIALELYKKMKDIPFTDALPKPLNQIEDDLEINGRSVCIVKDMSEIPTDGRKTILRQAIEDDKFWIIIANSGPLLDTCCDVYKEDYKDNQFNMENEILNAISKKLPDAFEKENPIKLFKKKMWIANLTMYDNIPMSKKLLLNIRQHALWQLCQKCPSYECCPITHNINSLSEDLVLNRISYLYRRLSAYDIHLTLRQISAHIAFSITGGLECSDIQHTIEINKKDIKYDYLISNNFFGFIGNKKQVALDDLFVVKALSKLELGAKPFHFLDEQFYDISLSQVIFPPEQQEVFELLISKLKSVPVSKPRYHQLLRRFFYFHGSFPDQTITTQFLNHLLLSPNLITIENWRESNTRTLKRRFKKEALSILLEEFTGMPTNVFSNTKDIYITLKRESTVPQDVQLVLAVLDDEDFEIEFNKIHHELKLIYIKENVAEDITLSLPLLDYISLKKDGSVGHSLDPIYKNQLENFKSKILGINNKKRNSSTKFLQLLNNGKLKRWDLEVTDESIYIK
jgi:serine/threonine protein kinase